MDVGAGYGTVGRQLEVEREQLTVGIGCGGAESEALTAHGVDENLSFVGHYFLLV
jgi:hypothetical protein